MDTPPKSNIVKFPNIKLDAPPQSLEEMVEQIVEYRVGFGTEMSEMLTQVVISELQNTGASLIHHQEEAIPLILMLQELILAIYLLGSGAEHPLQEIAHDLYGDFDDDTTEDEESKETEE